MFLAYPENVLFAKEIYFTYLKKTSICRDCFVCVIKVVLGSNVFHLFRKTTVSIYRDHLFS